MNLTTITHEDWQDLEARVYELERLMGRQDGAFKEILAEVSQRGETVESIDSAFPILKYFKFEHLPPHLQEVSMPFSSLAVAIASRCLDKKGDRAETAAGIRKLLEAKDCAVRATL